MSVKRWTRLDDVRARLERLWQRGDLLQACLAPIDATAEPLFPLAIKLKGPAPKDFTDDFSAVRNWTTHWHQQADKGITVAWQNRRHQQTGRNDLPHQVIFPDIDSALKLLRRNQESARFVALVQQITQSQPALADWCRSAPHRVLQCNDDWPRLLAVIDWLQQHPQPGVYLRQLELPGVHTKFIESNRGLLSELLDRCLPEAAINPEFSGARGFEARYGFRRKPTRIRFRLLDPTLAIRGLRDLSTPVDDFARLNLPVNQVFIVENDITALALPDRPGAMVIFGQGYGVDDLLCQANWLQTLPVFYWGDLDTHGFAILDQVRKVLPQARSLGMDLATLQQHQSLWGQEDKPTNRSLPRLTEHEQAVYQGLLDHRWGHALRLEQERIHITDVL